MKVYLLKAGRGDPDIPEREWVNVLVFVLTRFAGIPFGHPKQPTTHFRRCADGFRIGDHALPRFFR